MGKGQSLQPYKIGAWIRVYTNALMSDQSTKIGYVTEYGKCDFGPTVTIKNAIGGWEVPLAWIIGPVDVEKLEVNLPIVQRSFLDVNDLAPCIVPRVDAPIVAIIRPDQEWWVAKEGRPMWRTRKIAIRGQTAPADRAVRLFPELEKSGLVYNDEGTLND